MSVLQRGYLSDKVSHAYIFAGPDGVGKFTTASQFGKLLLCHKPVIKNAFADSCGQCESCISFDADSHPDFIHIYKELSEFTENGKDKKAPLDLAIDVIREFLIAAVPKKPMLSKQKVFVVSEAEKLNTSSQNALLKVLEEPPAYCCIILLCSRLEKLLATTRSRCQIIRFGQIEKKRIKERLEKMDLTAQQAEFFSGLADGSIGFACSLARLESAGAGLFEIKCELIKSLAQLKYEQSLELAQNFQKAAGSLAAVWPKIESETSSRDIKRRAINIIIRVVISALRDAMRLGLAEDERLTNIDQRQEIEKLSKKFEPEQAAKKIEDCFETIRYLESAVNERLLFEQLLLNLAGSDTMPQ